jgi:hypothetical protein
VVNLLNQKALSLSEITDRLSLLIEQSLVELTLQQDQGKI